MKSILAIVSLLISFSSPSFASQLITAEGDVNHNVFQARCGGVMNQSKAYSFFAPGSNQAQLGDFEFLSFRRYCSVPGGCTKWNQVQPGSMLGHYSFDQWPRFQTFGEFPESGKATLKYDARNKLTHLHLESVSSNSGPLFHINSNSCRGGEGYYSSVYASDGKGGLGNGNVSCDAALYGRYGVSFEWSSNVHLQGTLYEKCLILTDETQEKRVYVVAEF